MTGTAADVSGRYTSARKSKPSSIGTGKSRSMIMVSSRVEQPNRNRFLPCSSPNRVRYKIFGKADPLCRTWKHLRELGNFLRSSFQVSESKCSHRSGEGFELPSYRL